MIMDQDMISSEHVWIDWYFHAGGCKGTSSCTWYFALPSPPPVTEPLIVLNSTLQKAADEDGMRLVDVAFPSLVQPTYAPAGWDLAAVTVRGSGDKEGWLRSELEGLDDLCRTGSCCGFITCPSALPAALETSGAEIDLGRLSLRGSLCRAHFG